MHLVTEWNPKKNFIPHSLICILEMVLIPVGGWIGGPAALTDRWGRSLGCEQTQTGSGIWQVTPWLPHIVLILPVNLYTKYIFQEMSMVLPYYIIQRSTHCIRPTYTLSTLAQTQTNSWTYLHQYNTRIFWVVFLRALPSEGMNPALIGLSKLGPALIGRSALRDWMDLKDMELIGWQEAERGQTGVTVPWSSLANQGVLWDK